MALATTVVQDLSSGSEAWISGLRLLINIQGRAHQPSRHDIAHGVFWQGRIKAKAKVNAKTVQKVLCDGETT